MYINFSKLAKTLKVFGTTMAQPLLDFIIISAREIKHNFPTTNHEEC